MRVGKGARVRRDLNDNHPRERPPANFFPCLRYYEIRRLLYQDCQLRRSDTRRKFDFIPRDVD